MNLLLAILLGIVLVGGATLYIMPSNQPPPKLTDVYWGPGEPPKKTDTSVRPFKITFEKEMLDDLQNRLKNTRKMQPPLENVGWSYGVSSNSVANVVDYWRNKYDFKKREAYLNQYPQFITNIQGLDIHFIHVKPSLPKNSKIEVIPLYLQHGWPGSVVEFYKIIPMLTTPRADRNFVFEVVVPSLPGFGYSQASSKVGLGALQIAHVMKNLMLRLGFDKFYAQGGDWGGTIVAFMGAMYPEHVLGIHSNMCMILSRPWSLLKIVGYSFIPWLLPEDERQTMFPLSNRLTRLVEESGYFHIQATKPDTVGIGLNDSPAGLAAYILEKFSTATNRANRMTDDGNLLEKFKMDELIDNLMMYWAPRTITSSVRIYAESFNKASFKYKMDYVPVTVPSVCAHFPHELIFEPADILRDRYVNLLRQTKMPRGGHFAAFEEPQLLADDIWSALQEIRDYYVAKEKERLENQQS